MEKLQNDFLTVTISAKGAEPQSILQGDLERLWQADPAVWDRHAPLLFPFIGRLRGEEYLLNGVPHHIGTHGFCRDRIFCTDQISDTCVRYITTEDEETMSVYPFSFRLTIEYTLEGNTLSKKHIIRNTGYEAMPFEIGGHEAYATCLLSGESFRDYRVRFQGIDTISMFSMDENGILGLPKIDVALEDHCLTKTPEQLNIDTVVLENIPGSTVTLECAKSQHTITVSFPGFPYLGIWTKPLGEDTRYLCIEPWSALPDGHFQSKEFSEKPGVLTIQPGKEIELTYTMTFN